MDERLTSAKVARACEQLLVDRRTEVGVRALHDRLSEHLERVEQGAEVVVTRRGRPIARLSAVDREDHLADLVRRGLVTSPIWYGTQDSLRRTSRCAAMTRSTSRARSLSVTPSRSSAGIGS